MGQIEGDLAQIHSGPNFENSHFMALYVDNSQNFKNSAYSVPPERQRRRKKALTFEDDVIRLGSDHAPRPI